jgi:protein deglycase
MKRVLCILENGVEEIEAVTPVDLLRRAGLEVVMATVSSEEVIGRSGIGLRADAKLADLDLAEFDLLILPGGPAVTELRKNAGVLKVIRSFDEAGKIIAAICAAPLLLEDAGILNGRAFTAHFSNHQELPNSTSERVMIDGNLITSRGAGTALEFGLVLVEKLAGMAVSEEISNAIMA